MWTALGYAADSASEGGKLFIAIHNDQGTASRRCKKVEQLYNRLPNRCRFLVVWPFFWVLNWRSLVKDSLRASHSSRLRDHGRNRNLRGTSVWRKLIDWVGGYPFEVATPGPIFDFYRERGFLLTKLRTCGESLGCNEFVFEKR